MMGKLIDEWGPKCARCGGEEYRIDGYCSIYCRDMAEVEKENARQEKTIEALVDLIQSNMDERCAWCFGKGEHESDCEAMRVLSEVEE
jgi:hypothetical protein